MTVQTYSPNLVVVTFGGYVLENWDKITVRRSSQSFRQIRGIRGKNSRVKIKDTSAEIELEVSQTNEINYIFSEILRLDELNGNSRLEITIKDVSGIEVFSSKEAYVEGLPERVYGREINTRVWRILCLTSENSSSPTSWDLGNLFSNI